MQERALMHLGGMQWRDAVPVVLGRLKAPGAGAGAMIACLGEIGDESAVPAITPFLGSADHFDAAAIALARINTSASNRALDAMLRELRRDARQQSRVEMLQRLRSPGFVEEDGARRLEARGRYPRA
jgi:hypothetical protein